MALPGVVFDHYRNPRHQAGLAEPDAVGRIEGRREDSEIRFYLRLDPDGGAQVWYELVRDRSPLAALSLLASLVQGWSLEQLEGLTLESFAAHYELDREMWPSLLLAHEALNAALVALKGQRSPSEGPVICECLFVRRGRIERLIRERRLRTVDEVRFWTRACSGCRSCRPEVEEILAEVLRP